MTGIRPNFANTHTKARSGTARATIREIDDKHLMQQVKQADAMHSETASNFERWQMVGLTSVPLKQEEKQGQQSQQGQQSGGDDQAEGDWNHNQPKGKAAEALMLYVGGSHSHPVAMVDDRRVRPYAMKPGETALYDAGGTGQMTFFNDKGAYLVSVNNPQEQAQSQNEVERFASLRHVTKSKQSREIKKGQEVKEHKHEGETVNLEVRATKTRIEFRAGDEVIGYYDKAAATWMFKGKVKLGGDDATKLVHRKGNVDDAGNEPLPVYKSGTEVYTV